MSAATTTGPGLQTGAGLLLKSLEAQGVKYIFGIPGAKIDKVFDTLLDSTIKTVVCRHEQNAAFIAGGIGRMTGKAGVALVTSGPGCSNLATGLATAADLVFDKYKAPAMSRPAKTMAIGTAIFSIFINIF